MSERAVRSPVARSPFPVGREIAHDVFGVAVDLGADVLPLALQSADASPITRKAVSPAELGALPMIEFALSRALDAEVVSAASCDVCRSEDLQVRG